MAAKQIYNVSAVYNDPKGTAEAAIVLTQTEILAGSAESAKLIAIRMIDAEWDSKLDDITFNAVPVKGNFC